jgi:hypothetical protein
VSLEAPERPKRRRKPYVPKLMGAREAAERLGVLTPNLHKVPGLPKPVQRLASGPVWRASDIHALARKRARLAKRRNGKP